MWTYDSEGEMMVQKKIDFVPGLYKIFDEILVNAADNKQRDQSMDCIKIEIKPEENMISIWNNGQGKFSHSNLHSKFIIYFCNRYSCCHA